MSSYILDRRVLTLALLGVVSVSVTAAGNDHWSFRPITRPHPSAVPGPNPVLNAVDAFIQARLHEKNLLPSHLPGKATLIRRVTLDLIGLPPSWSDVTAFERDERPDAYERVVDRLLASPQYGERWARVWLDLCHYGDTDGHLTDQLRPVAWRYRDWVVQALNDNLPFDEFTISQIAGDLVSPNTDQILGTGFLRQTLSNREGGADLEEFRVEQVVERTSMVGTIWLGLTVGCARCHDHKYDPLSQREFFQLYAYFDQADEINIDAPLAHEREAYLRLRPEYEKRRQALIEPFRDGLTALQKRWEEKCLHAFRHPGQDHVWDRQWELLGLIWGGGLGEGQLEGTEIVKLSWSRRTPRQQHDLLDYFLQHGAVVDETRFAELKLGTLRNQLAELKKGMSEVAVTRAPVMQVALTPRETYLHERGDFRSPGSMVQPGTPAWLPPLPATDGESAAHPRWAFARWLVAPENPLTPRVVVNRMWQDFFGRGLVATSNDFGLRGDPPSHPALLDWLADEFIQTGWDVKAMHRRIVTSATYRQSSMPRADLSLIDPENVLLARQSSLRVPAETVRDAALSASGLLQNRMGGPGVFPPQHERVTMEAFGSNSWKASEGADRYRRSLYTFLQRTSPFAQGIIFDAPSPQFTCTRRDRSNTPLQALTLLNDPMFAEIAEALGERIQQSDAATDRERIEYAWRTCLGRSATPEETDRLMAYLKEQRASQNPGDSAKIHWQNLASVLLNLHEFITRD